MSFLHIPGDDAADLDRKDGGNRPWLVYGCQEQEEKISILVPSRLEMVGTYQTPLGPRCDNLQARGTMAGKEVKSNRTGRRKEKGQTKEEKKKSKEKETRGLLSKGGRWRIERKAKGAGIDEGAKTKKMVG